VAGNGNWGFSGDGGPATSTSLSAPAGVALDSAGNLYIADFMNKPDPEGVWRNNHDGRRKWNQGFSGDGGPATSAGLTLPQGVAVDSAGNLYIADWGNDRIRKVSGGTITTVAGGGTGATEGRPPAHGSNGPREWPWIRLATSTSPTRATSGSGRCLADDHDGGRGWDQGLGDGGRPPARRSRGPRSSRRFGWQHLHRDTNDYRVRRVAGGRLRRSPEMELTDTLATEGPPSAHRSTGPTA